MANKKISVEAITDVTGNVYKIVERDADGEPVWAKEPEPDRLCSACKAQRMPFRGEYKEKPATTLEVLYTIPLQINAHGNLPRANDGDYSRRLYSALRRCWEATAPPTELTDEEKAKWPADPKVHIGKTLLLHEKVYAWCFRVLQRKVPGPPVPEDASDEVKKKWPKEGTLGRRMFGISSEWITNQLKDVETRKSADDMPLPEEGKEENEA